MYIRIILYYINYIINTSTILNIKLLEVGWSLNENRVK